jgi:hypothetical protein
MDDPVEALAVSGTNLYAGGQFTTAGGVAASSIAVWNGSAWSALGSGTSGETPNGSGPYTLALATDGVGHLFVGGIFLFAGTNLSPFVAQANIPPGYLIDSIAVSQGMATLDCQGAPWASYSVERATDAWLTQDLMTLLVTNAPDNGVFLFTDPDPPKPAAFYRMLQQ